MRRAHVLRAVLGTSLLLVVALVGGCAGVGPQPIAPSPPPGNHNASIDGAPGANTAPIVRDVTFVITASYPARVLARLHLDLPDTCTEVDAISQSRTGNRVDVTITTRRAGQACAEVLRSLQRDVWFDGAFEAGRYIVRVNGVERQLVI